MKHKGTHLKRCFAPGIQAAPPGQVASDVLGHPVRRAALVAAFAEAFKFEGSASILQLSAGTASMSMNILPRDAPAVSPLNDSPPASSPLQSAGDAGSVSASEAAVMLPRMPRGLLYLRSRPTYQAVAIALRTGGRVSTAAPGALLSSLHTHRPCCPAGQIF